MDYTLNVDGTLVTVDADNIFDAFRRARALYPRAVVVTDTATD